MQIVLINITNIKILSSNIPPNVSNDWMACEDFISLSDSWPVNASKCYICSLIIVKHSLSCTITRLLHQPLDQWPILLKPLRS